jgi:hypothetical protein
MSDRFDEDLLDDPTGELRKGSSALDELEGGDELEGADEFDEGDGFDEGDEADEADELEAMDGLDAGDEYDSMEEEADAFDEESGSDEFEEAMTDALEAGDTDEFFGGLGRMFKRIGRGVGSVARTIAPIAKLIPLPQAQMIGRAAGLIGNVLADEGDELDAFEELADYADEEDAVDALAPALAGVAIRSGLKHRVARLPRVHRRLLVKTMAKSVRHLARRHGPAAVRALPGIVAVARRALVRRRLHPRHLPRLVAQTTRVAARSPRVLRRLVRVTNRLKAARPSRYRAMGGARRMGRGRLRTHGGMGAHGGTVAARRVGNRWVCPSCGVRRRGMRLRGPVHLTIEGG